MEGYKENLPSYAQGEGREFLASVFQEYKVSVCVMLANILLAKGSPKAKSRVHVRGA